MSEKREEIQKIFTQAKNGAKEMIQDKKQEEIKQEITKEVKQTQQAADKVPLLFMTEINTNLDKAAIGIFKEALKKLKFGQLPDIDLFTKEVKTTYVFTLFRFLKHSSTPHLIWFCPKRIMLKNSENRLDRQLTTK